MDKFKGFDDLQAVQVPSGSSVEETIKAYQLSGLVDYAEPDYILQAALAPNDPMFLNGTLWGLNNLGQSPSVAGADIDAPLAWDTQTSAGDVVVAVIDSGVRYTHEDLAANMWTNPRDGSHGINVLTGSNNPMDDYGHGTMIAGIIGAAGNNGKGVSGVAWRVQIMACKFMDASGNGFVSDAIKCIDYARTNGAQIINASWGGPANSAALADAIASAGRDGIIVVAAAGNNSADLDATPFYPASLDLDNVVAVAATTQADALASFSNYGFESVDVAAPGNLIYSTGHSGDGVYACGSGTSFAAPFVSGAFALMRVTCPTLSHKNLIARLLAVTDPVPDLAGKCVSGGRLNLANALCPAVLANFTATPPAGSTPLTVNFTDASQGAITNCVWDFGDGTRLTNVLNPSRVFTNEGTFSVTLSVISDKGANSHAVQPVRTVANYAILSGGFQWLDPSLMFPLTLNSNGVTSAINLPFQFYFYGKCYQQITIAANGVIGFGTQGLPIPTHTELPDTNAPNAIVCPFWTDLSVPSVGSVWLAVRGKPPQRRLILAWAVPGNINFEAVLFESSQRILFQYLLPEADPPSVAAAQSATVGVEHESGLVAAQYSANGMATLTNQQAMLFVPTSNAGVTNYPVATMSMLPRSVEGNFQLRLAGQPASTYAVEASADLENWEQVGSGVTDLDGLISFADTQSGNWVKRFYRARFAP